MVKGSDCGCVSGRGRWGATASTRQGFAHAFTPLLASHVARWCPYGTDIGVENLRISFPATPYTGEWSSSNLNAILMYGVYNGWVRNVDIVNADVAIRADRCQLVTLTSVNIIAGEGGHPPPGGERRGGSTWQVDFRCFVLEAVIPSRPESCPLSTQVGHCTGTLQTAAPPALAPAPPQPRLGGRWVARAASGSAAAPTCWSTASH